MSVQRYINSFINHTGLPFVSSLRSTGWIGSNNSLYCGFIGTYGNRASNLILKAADLLFVVGSRLDVRQTGSDRSDFTDSKHIIHLSDDPHDIDFCDVHTSTRINATIRDFLSPLIMKTY